MKGLGKEVVDATDFTLVYDQLCEGRCAHGNDGNLLSGLLVTINGFFHFSYSLGHLQSEFILKERDLVLT